MFHLGGSEKENINIATQFLGKYLQSSTGKNTGIIKFPIAERRHQMYTKCMVTFRDVFFLNSALFGLVSYNHP